MISSKLNITLALPYNLKKQDHKKMKLFPSNLTTYQEKRKLTNIYMNMKTSYTQQGKIHD